MVRVVEGLGMWDTARDGRDARGLRGAGRQGGDEDGDGDEEGGMTEEWGDGGVCLRCASLFGQPVAGYLPSVGSRSCDGYFGGMS